MPYTEENLLQEETKKALLLAGIKEIERVGISGLSLRKVAAECGVSCATPYRHFESKADFVFAIIAYVNSRWDLLKKQIASAFSDNKKRMVTELCTATVLFWRANPNFKSIMMLDDKVLDNQQRTEKNRISDEICRLAQQLCNNNSEKTVFLVRALLCGAAAYETTDISLIK